ncbi:MAG: CHAT domain-containing protein, partial [Cyanobacteria bacterium P01_F01_bin.143]
TATSFFPSFFRDLWVKHRLYDGEQYLIQKDYNIALTEGLKLIDPQPLKRQPIKVLAAGTTRAEIGFLEIPKLEEELKFIGELFPDSQVKDELNLEEELINFIIKLFPDSQVLSNDRFILANLHKKLEAEYYPIVHVQLTAYNQFGSTSDQTFILSGSDLEDDLTINVKQFDDLRRISRVIINRQSQRIELLVLSDVNFAQEDTQAVRELESRAQSMIAPLWDANDEATVELMRYFYQNLSQNQDISKAEALRNAQLKLLQNPNYSHPYYWAPFVLIGNWL